MPWYDCGGQRTTLGVFSLPLLVAQTSYFGVVYSRIAGLRVSERFSCLFFPSHCRSAGVLADWENTTLIPREKQKGGWVDG